MWNGDLFDPNRPSNENFSTDSKYYFDMGVGVNLRKQWRNKRTKLDVGAGFFHVNQPKINFYDNDDTRLPMRANGYILPVVEVGEKGDIVGAGNLQFQGDYLEALVNAGYRYHISTQRSKEVSVQLMLGYRFHQIGDAFMPALELQYRDLMVGLSWDMNVSQFHTATRYHGGMELAVRYIIHKVYPIKAFKACPLI
jgi:hypothetical protein